MTKKSRIKKAHANGQNKIKEWSTRISALGGVIAIILGVLAILPAIRSHLEAYKELSNPNQLVIIQSSKIKQSLAKLITDDDPSQVSFKDISMRYPPVECLNIKHPECEVILFLSKWEKPADYSIDLVISSFATSPIIIDGLSVVLTDYRSLPDDTQDIFLNFAIGTGGGKVSRAYSLPEFPLYDRQGIFTSMPFEVGDPAQSIGVSQLARLDCEGVPSCEDVVFLEDANDVEGIKLSMPFLDSLPPGWYSFELNIAFSYNGQQFNSQDNVKFDVIKPSLVHVWYGFDGAQPLRSEFLKYSVLTGEYEIPIIAPEPNNVPGTLVYQYQFTNLILDLQTNKIATFPSTGFYSHEEQQIIDQDIQTELSPDGTRLVSAVFKDGSSDLELIDLRSLEPQNLTSSVNIREIYPSWSPSGEQIAFVGLAVSDTPTLREGEADLFVYDLSTADIRRITNTPSIIEAYPTWINENKVSFLFTTSSNQQSENDFSLAIVDLSNGDNWADNQAEISDPFIDNVNYLPLNDLIIISSFDDQIMAFDREGNLEFNLKETKETREICSILDSIPLNQLCVGPRGAYMASTTGDGQRWLITYESDYPNWPIIVQVPSGGFAIIDIRNGNLIHYDYNGEEIRSWSMSELKEAGGLSGIHRPVLLTDR